MTKEVERSTKIEYELDAYAEVLKKTFFVRRDLFAQQLPDGRYTAVYDTLTTRHVENHLKGKVTLGTYLIDPLDRSRFMVLDDDREEGLGELCGLSERLSLEGIPSYLEASRRGGHLWFFFDQPYPARKVRHFGKSLIDLYHVGKIELYPKQDTLGEGVGSLIRLPFGVHLKSGKRYPFIKPNGELLAETIRGQIAELAHARTVPAMVVETFSAREAVREEKTVQVKEGNGSEFTERLKNSFDIVNFIGAYVDLRETPSGAVGRCPFHDDQTPSFGVSKKGFWHCFSGCGGGDVISFWMKYKNIDFGRAVYELSEMKKTLDR